MKPIYKVYINGRFKKTCHSTKEAWKIIGESPFGSLYEVRDINGDIVPEFVPF